MINVSYFILPQFGSEIKRNLKKRMKRRESTRKKVRRATYLFSVLLDFDVDLLAACAGSSLHHGADSLSNLTVLTDNHTHIILCNAQNEVNGVVVFGLQNGDFIGTVNDCFRNLDQGFLQINHVSSPDP
jgi:hypothetical protein